MSMTDPIADMLTRIRNAVHASHPIVGYSGFQAEAARSPRSSRRKAMSPRYLSKTTGHARHAVDSSSNTRATSLQSRACVASAPRANVATPVVMTSPRSTTALASASSAPRRA